MEEKPCRKRDIQVAGYRLQVAEKLPLQPATCNLQPELFSYFALQNQSINGQDHTIPGSFREAMTEEMRRDERVFCWVKKLQNIMVLISKPRHA
jgi:hypothetical protein